MQITREEIGFFVTLNQIMFFNNLFRALYSKKYEQC